MEKLIKEFREEFFKELEGKPTWGRNSVKELFIMTFNNTLLRNLKKDNSEE